ncbi:unnamed protein product [Linum tenue]|uniref:Fringe-like glycosyltransferase domain-containing protein n=1 Tax=Linum tenue TaxID=586396 RepID=A0AAV0KSX5_9ROSI|nr:unnamed protein product [Linum tenue]CAI0448241.1 unnamed protein product [Linum tenue]
MLGSWESSPLVLLSVTTCTGQGHQANRGLRWFMVCDDDTLVLVNNLVEVLNKFDHTEYHYIGGNSECVKSNADFSFDMAFGGAVYALS